MLKLVGIAETLYNKDNIPKYQCYILTIERFQ